MIKTKCRSWVILVLLFAVVFMAGCETVKGTAQGFKKDWDNWTGRDKELQEVLW